MDQALYHQLRHTLYVHDALEASLYLNIPFTHRQNPPIPERHPKQINRLPAATPHGPTRLGWTPP